MYMYMYIRSRSDQSVDEDMAASPCVWHCTRTHARTHGGTLTKMIIIRLEQEEDHHHHHH